jgi:uncharacterized protein involved in exopolysaccharide biosynthesis
VRRYAETVLRHPVAFCVPIVLAFVVSLWLTQGQPREYVSQASLWADAPVPNDTTILNAPNPTPAEQEMGVLQELLHTRKFVGGVWDRLVADGVEHGPPNDTQLGSLAKSIGVATGGAHILALAVTDRTPAHARAAAKAAIAELIAEVATTRQNRLKQLVTFYTDQVNAASQELANAQDQLAAYLAAHPAGSNSTESGTGEAAVEGALITARQHFDDASASLLTAQQGLDSAKDSTELRVVDAPVLPGGPQSRKKQLAFAGVAGLVAGGLVSLLTLIFLVATDTSVRTVHDLDDDLAPRVIGTIPQLKRERAS